MSYHDIPSSARRSTTNGQGQTAPAGYHYMPDGTLMSDIEHARLYGATSESQVAKSTQHDKKYYNPYERDPVNVETQIGVANKVIKSFNLDLSDLPAESETRNFTITGNKDAEFILEIKNEDNYYYNFTTNLFQVAQSRLEETILNFNYRGSIVFPTVTDDDQYDIYLYAKPGTIHAPYTEARFADESLDLNNSKGSNSLMMQKVIYQYTDLTLTISPNSPNSVTDLIKSSSLVNDTIVIPRLKEKGKIPFRLSCEVNTATKAYQIKRQPTHQDMFSLFSLTVDATPEDLPGEDIYPTARHAFTGDDVNGAITSGDRVRMDNTDLSEVIAVGDKITSPVTSGTLNSEDELTVVTLDEDVATIMAVGDAVTGEGCPECDANPGFDAC